MRQAPCGCLTAQARRPPALSLRREARRARQQPACAPLIWAPHGACTLRAAGLSALWEGGGPCSRRRVAVNPPGRSQQCGAASPPYPSSLPPPRPPPPPPPPPPPHIPPLRPGGFKGAAPPIRGAMPNFCAAPNCTRKSTQSDLAFFRFPRDPVR